MIPLFFLPSGKSSLKSSHSSTPVSGYSWIDTDTLTYMTEPIDTKVNTNNPLINIVNQYRPYLL